MSSILKALKKAEDDKATRRPDELRIDAEIPEIIRLCLKNCILSSEDEQFPSVRPL